MRIYTGFLYEEKFYTKSYKFKNRLTGRYQTNIVKGFTVTEKIRNADPSFVKTPNFENIMKEYGEMLKANRV